MHMHTKYKKILVPMPRLPPPTDGLWIFNCMSFLLSLLNVYFDGDIPINNKNPRSDTHEIPVNCRNP